MLKLLIQKSLDNLLLENIEALAAGESRDLVVRVSEEVQLFVRLPRQGVEHVHIYYSMPH